MADKVTIDTMAYVLAEGLESAIEIKLMAISERMDDLESNANNMEAEIEELRATVEATP